MRSLLGFATIAFAVALGRGPDPAKADLVIHIGGGNLSPVTPNPVTATQLVLVDSRATPN